MLVRLNTNNDGNRITLGHCLDCARIEPARFIELACRVWRRGSLLYFGCADEHTILENALLHHIAIGEGINTLTGKLPIPKLTHVAITIGAFEAAVTIELVPYKLAFVLAAIRKIKNAFAVPASLEELPDVAIITIGLLDGLFTIALFFTVNELTGIQNALATCQSTDAAVPA